MQRRMWPTRRSIRQGERGVSLGAGLGCLGAFSFFSFLGWDGRSVVVEVAAAVEAEAGDGLVCWAVAAASLAVGARGFECPLRGVSWVSAVWVVAAASLAVGARGF